MDLAVPPPEYRTSSRRLLAAAVWVLLSIVSGACATTRHADVASRDSEGRQGTVLLVSLDGFGRDFLDRFTPEHLSALAADGVRADGLIPVFPTKTFPNHYTIVTGLYPAHHGIVSNTIYDPDRDAYFRMSDRDAVTDPAWWMGEPIWVTAERQGLVTATYFWPGSEAPIAGVQPSYWKPFDADVPAAERVAAVLRWLEMPPAERPSFIALYFDDVDRAGHRFGVGDPRTAEAAREVDRHLGDLVAGLRTRDLFDTVNVIVVSDHGMVDRSPDRVIFLDDYVGPEDARVIEWSPVLSLYPAALSADSLYARLAGAHPHLKVYRRGQLPSRLRYSGSKRIAPIVGIADEGWSIGRRARFEARYYEGGDHGYDNALRSMQGLFVAHGPAFRPGVRVPAIENIHLYALMADILGVTPAANDGLLSATTSLRRRAATTGMNYRAPSQ